MQATTSSALQLLPGQFEQIHQLLNSFELTAFPDYSMRLGFDFGTREVFYILSNIWLEMFQNNKLANDKFFEGIQKILQPGQELTIQCIAGEDLSFPFRALQVRISSLFIEIDGF